MSLKVAGVANAAKVGGVSNPAKVGGVTTGASSSIDYDFTTGSLPAGCSFANASSNGVPSYFNSSGVLSYVNADTPRFDYQYNGSSWVLGGILIEPQRTNTSRQGSLVSEGNLDTTTGQSDPAGGTTAKLFAENTTSSVLHQTSAYTSIAATSGSQYAISAYIKGGTLSFAQVYSRITSFANGYINVDLSNKDLEAAGSGIDSYSIKDKGNGWLRASFVDTSSTTSNSASVYVVTLTSGTEGIAPSVTGSDRSFTECFTQHELIGSGERQESTSYIPTTNASVTRSADVLSFTIPDGVTTMRYTFDDDSTQDVSVSAGTYTVPTNLNRARIKRIQSV